MEEFGPLSTLNDIIIPKNSKSSKKSPQKKSITPIVVLLIIFAIILTSIAIALIIIILLRSDSDSETIGKNDAINAGEIKALYDIKNPDKEILILGKEFKSLDNLTIYINEIKIENSEIKNHFYKFKDKGFHTIKFVINTNGGFDMEKMFENIIELKEVEMYSGNGLKLKSMNSAFKGCINLELFDMKGFNTSEIVSFKELFHKTKLNKIDLKSFVDLKSAEDMSYMFAETKLIKVDLSYFKNANNLKDISYMFYNCDSLERVNMGDFTGNVIFMQHLFDNCTSLIDLNSDQLQTGNVINM